MACSAIQPPGELAAPGHISTAAAAAEGALKRRSTAGAQRRAAAAVAEPPLQRCLLLFRQFGGALPKGKAAVEDHGRERRDAGRGVTWLLRRRRLRLI